MLAERRSSWSLVRSAGVRIRVVAKFESFRAAVAA